MCQRFIESTCKVDMTTELILTVAKFRAMCLNLAAEGRVPTRVILTQEARRALTDDSFDHWLYIGSPAMRFEHHRFGNIGQLIHPLTGESIPVETGEENYVLLRRVGADAAEHGLSSVRYLLTMLLNHYGTEQPKEVPPSPPAMRLRVTGGPGPGAVRVEDMDTGRTVPATKLHLDPVKPGGLLKATVEVLIDELDLQLDSQSAWVTVDAGNSFTQIGREADGG